MSESIIIKSDPNQTLAQIQAEVAAFEANPVDPGAPDVPTAQTVNAPATVTPPEKAALPDPVTPPATEPAKPTQQPQETAVKVATATEPAKETDWKGGYKGLQRKIDQLQRELASKETTKPSREELIESITPEFKQKLIADLEKDPVEAILEIARAVARKELNPVKSKVEASEHERLQAAQLNGLDRLVQEGHEWLKTPDGLSKMEAALNENPELWKTKDPYRAALGFISDIPSKAQQPSHAQTTGLTPMLGAGGVVPTTVSAPAVSKVEKLTALNAEADIALARGNTKRVQELLAQMEEIDRGY